MAEEEASELAGIKQKQLEGAELTPGERRAWRREERKRKRLHDMMEQPCAAPETAVLVTT